VSDAERCEVEWGERAIDRAERAEDRAERVEDRLLAIHAEAAYALIRRWSRYAVVALTLLIFISWGAVIYRQHGIIGNLIQNNQEILEVQKVLENRTQRFERLEGIERNQSEMLEKLLERESKLKP